MKQSLVLTILFTFCSFGTAGYSTPGTGVRWNFDSLVVHSGGIVSGSFPQYVVSDTLFISPTDVLDIRKGSLVRIAYRKGITVRGGFLAIGTKDSMITFTKHDSTWQELRFEDSAIDSLCRMEYLLVEYARLGLNFVSASPTLLYSTIRNTGAVSGTLAGSGNYAIQCFNSAAVIRYDSIYNNAQYGININSNASPIIEHNVIFNNNLQGTGFKNQISVGAQGINSPVIRFNTIYHTTPNIIVGGISVSALFAGSGSNAVIENNTIYQNAYGIAVLSGGTSTVNVTIRKNKIFKNTYSNPNTAGSGINFNASAPSVQNSIVAENEIYDNLWGITILGTAAPNLGDLSNADSTDNGRNIIINNKNRDTVFALYNNTATRIMAQNNYWGSSHPDTVAAVIFDSSDIGSLGKVSYLPYLQHSPVTSVRPPANLPASISLGQNFPNPFNPVTTIPFSLPASGESSLIVYDLLGRVVSVLHNGELTGGTVHYRQFDGSTVASGVYLVRLTAGGITVNRKMLLIK